MYATTQNNLGNAYADLPAGDRAANLNRAIDCYTQALRFFTAEADPRLYAVTQDNLGNAYAEPSDRGPGGQPGPGNRLLHRGAAVLHRRGRPV